MMIFRSENLHQEIPSWPMLQMKEFCHSEGTPAESFPRGKVGSWPQTALDNPSVPHHKVILPS